MKTVLTVVMSAVLMTAAPSVFAKSKAHGPYTTNVHTTYMQDDPLVCKQSLHYPGAAGSGEMVRLPESVLLYNYRHVTGPNPVVMKARALGAIRCYSDLDDSGYMIGLRGAFEAMGATVTVSKDGKQISVAKPGLALQLVVGKPSIRLDGQDRPLDVPPIVARGIIYVPIRVISESLGGYVVWDGRLRSVVIRYLPVAIATPMTTPAPLPTDRESPIPTATPTAAPTPAPTPVPATRLRTYEHFIVGDYLFSPKSYSALSAGTSAGSSFAARAAFEIPLGSLPVLIGGDFRDFAYAHTASSFTAFAVVGQAANAYTACPQNGFNGCASVPGRNASIYVPAFNGNDSSVSANLGIGLGAGSHVYLEASFISLFNNFPSTYPSVPTLSGVGFGAEKLPDLSTELSFYGSVYYYPSVSGTYDYPAGLPPPTSGASGNLQESIFKYQVGLTAKLGASGLFADAGFLGDSIKAKNLSPSDASHTAGLVGLGVNF